MNPRIFFYTSALLLANLLVAEITVQTRFSQPQVALGNPVQYIVEISATYSNSKPDLPAISSLPITDTGGLRLRNGRTSNNSNTRIFNGQAEYQLTQSAIIDVIPPAVGTYTIPSFQMAIGAQTYRAPAATLVVVENSEGELVFIDSTLPKELHIGQTTAIELKLYIAEGVRSPRIRSYELTADGFSAPTQLPDNEEETSEFLNGRRYQVITWPMELTPLTAGTQELEVQFMISAQIPNRGSQSYSNRSPFGGSMFDDFFGRSENFPVYLSHTVQVQPLPETNKPESFSGAIGDFAMEVSTDLQKSEVGEPIMLSLKITGQGNFERIRGPELPSDSTWKIYSPEGQLETDPESGKPHSKRFDYVMIPKQPGTLQTPEIRFSFFDPQTKAYTELEGPPLTIEVAPSTNRYAPSIPNAAAIDSEANDPLIPDLSRAITREEALMTLDYQPRKGRTLSRTSPLSSAWFIALNVGLALLTAAAAILLRKQAQLREDANYAALKQITDDLKQASSAAAKATQIDEFYQHALTVLRLSISRKAKQNLRTAELPQLMTHLEAWDLSPEVLDAITTLFTDAYQTRFSGSTTVADLAQARAQLNLAHKSL